MAGFDGYGMPKLGADFFSPLAQLPEVYQQAKMKGNRERTLAELANGANVGDVANKLFQAGDIEGGLSLAKLADSQQQRDFLRSANERDFAFRQQEAQRTQQNSDRSFGEGVRQFDVGRTPSPASERDFSFRQEEARRAQTNADRSYGLQERTFEAGQEKPQVVWQEGPNGEKEPFLVQPQGRGVRRLPIEGEGGGQPNNPFSQGGKVNESQSKDGLYASRMLASEQILRDPKVEAAALSSGNRATSALSEKIPFGLARSRVPEGFQKFDQAKRDFINATLRRESGATIQPSEFESADKQYFPLPGDTPGVLAQKRANRAEAIKGIAAGAGKGYRFQFKFDDKGEIVPNDTQTGALTRVESGPQVKPGTQPVPPAFANDPEGTEYHKDGKVWIRQGNQLVPK